MDKQDRKGIISAFFILLILFTHWGCTQRRGEDETYIGNYNPGDLITVVQEEGYPDIQFPRNQLLIQVAEGITRDQTLTIIDQIGGTLIGQIPTVGIYQVTVRTTSKEELDQIRDSLKVRSEITGVSYNLLCTQAGIDFSRCPVMPDLRVVFEEDNAFDLCNYYTALEIVAGLRDAISMSRVTIGLNEYGYNPSNGEFDDVTILNVSPDGVSLNPDDAHGNAIAGVICADNDGNINGINGIASSFLENKLEVVMSSPANDSVVAYMASMHQLALNADIVVNALYAGPFALDDDYNDGVSMCKSIIQLYPNVFFVNAAPNLNLAVTPANSLPAGIRSDNTITVSAASIEDPGERMEDAGWGYGVAISAPGQVPIIDSGGHFDVGIGTSFAAAQVASATALLKSVGRNHLSNSEIKQYLMPFLSTPVEPGGGVLLDYSNSLVDLLWDMYQEQPWAVRVMDWNEDGICDPHSSIIARLCEEVNFEVEELDDFTVHPDVPCGNVTNAIFLNESGTNIVIDFWAHSEDSNFALVNFNTVSYAERLFEQAFKEHLTICSDDCDVWMQLRVCPDPERDCACNVQSATGVDYNGYADSGTLKITRCQVSERTPQGEPRSLFIDMYFDCTIQGMVQYYPDEPEFLTTDASGWIRSVTVRPLSPLGTFDEYIDELCSEIPDEPEETG